MYDADVIIVGAGLTGLRAALELSRGGLSVLVVESGRSVGGRLKTSQVEGALLDHGFQVLLSGYPELASVPNLDSLKTRSFWAGARVRYNSRFYDVYDLLRHPIRGLRTLTEPIASISDLIRLGIFSLSGSAMRATACGRSTAETVDAHRYTSLFRGAFLKPFLRGVLLDEALASDAGLARFYLRIFSKSPAALPAKGIQALPELLADSLGRGHIVLDARVVSLKAQAAILESGEELRARRVVCATDALNAASLSGPDQTVPHTGTTTLYFLADHPPYSEPILVLNGDQSGPINNLTVLSNVQPTYAPPGASLISASIVGASALLPESVLVPQVRTQLHQWYGGETARWKLVRTFSIPDALPARPRLSAGWNEHQGVLFAGDYLSYGSQNGALAAGRMVAQHIISTS